MENIENLANTLWNYMVLNQEIKPFDLLLVLGSHDLRVAEYAAVLEQKYKPKHIIFSGGIAHKGDLLETAWHKTEAEAFYTHALKHGLPAQTNIFLEKHATNTGENLKFSTQILQKEQIQPSNWLLLTKPYMERRAFATVQAQGAKWIKSFQVTSPQMNLEKYCNTTQFSLELVTNIMVGDLYRIITYPEKGFQSKQHIPEHVLEAYHTLIEMGFKQHLPKN